MYDQNALTSTVKKPESEFKPDVLFVYQCWFAQHPELITDELTQGLEAMARTTESRYVSNQGGWQSPTFRRGKHSWIEPMIQTTQDLLVPVYESLGYTHEPKLSEYWVNINPPGTFNWAHLHPNSLVSTVFWLQAPKDSGCLVFETPTPHWRPATILSEANMYEQRVVPAPGLLAAFPSCLSHRVEPNAGKDPRISIAFNWL